MSVTVQREPDNLFVVTIKGVFTYDDLKEVESYAERKEQKKQVKILVHAEEFEGWGKEGDWGDLTFMYEHDPYIEKIAVMSGERWKDEILMFIGAGRRQAQVQFFFDDEEEDAREWLENNDVPALIHSSACRNGREDYSSHFITEESIAVLGLLRSAVFVDFPKLKLVISHGGGSVPYQVGRWIAESVHPLFSKNRPLQEHFIDSMKRLYYDSCI